jgi:hypothetical protein
MTRWITGIVLFCMLAGDATAKGPIVTATKETAVPAGIPVGKKAGKSTAGRSRRPRPLSRFKYHLELDRKSLPKGVISKVRLVPGTNQRQVWIKNPGKTPLQQVGSRRLANGKVYRYSQSKGWTVVKGVQWQLLYLNRTPGCIVKGRDRGLPVTAGVPASEETSWAWQYGDKEIKIKAEIVYSINEKYDNKIKAKSTAEVLQDVVINWLDDVTGKGKLYKATIRGSDNVLPMPSKKINDRLFAFQDDEVYIGIGFSKPPAMGSTPEQLQKTLKHIALDRVCVPGIDAAGWMIRLQTPQSSFKKGVTIKSLKDGVLSVRVQTEFFAVYGRRTDIRVPADAGMPKGTYFQIRKPIKADLLIEGRLFPAKKKKKNPAKN